LTWFSTKKAKNRYFLPIGEAKIEDFQKNVQNIKKVKWALQNHFQHFIKKDP
jgi:hypothetical protein